RFPRRADTVAFRETPRRRRIAIPPRDPTRRGHHNCRRRCGQARPWRPCDWPRLRERTAGGFPFSSPWLRLPTIVGAGGDEGSKQGLEIFALVANKRGLQYVFRPNSRFLNGLAMIR